MSSALQSSFSRLRLRRSRVAVAVVFVLLGLLQGTLAARMPAVKDAADLRDDLEADASTAAYAYAAFSLTMLTTRFHRHPGPQSSPGIIPLHRATVPPSIRHPTPADHMAESP